MTDTSKTNAAYASGLGFLMLLALASSNVPELAASAYFDLPHRKLWCAGLFSAGALAGCWALLRNMARSAKPWQVPLAQVTLPYTVFFLLTLAAIAISH